LLLEGFALDAALLDLMQPVIRTNRRIRVALDRYGSGQESEALDMLAKATQNASTAILAEYAVEDSFLIAAVLATKI